MSNFQINYQYPWLLLLIIPAVLLTLIPYFRLDKRYRCTRNRIISMTLHIIAMVLAINVLSGISFTYDVPNEENELIILVDTSDSTRGCADERDELVRSLLDVAIEDCRVGIVKFGDGYNYAVELTDNKDSIYSEYLGSESPGGAATALADALKYSATLFKNKNAAKIVVLSDGLETDGDARLALSGIVGEGVRVDALPLSGSDVSDVQIISLALESDEVEIGEKFITNVVIKSNSAEEKEVALLRLYDNGEQYGETFITLEPGENTFPASLEIKERGVHELTFELITDYELLGEPLADEVRENNTYRMYVSLEVHENILLIERDEGEGRMLKEILAENKRVTDISVEEDLADFPSAIEDLAKYEEIILVNIAYSDMPAGFEGLLHTYVHELGGGLFTVGGKNDIGVGGIEQPHAYNGLDLKNSTYYKNMLPVKIKEYTPPIALMILVDTSTSMDKDDKRGAALDGAIVCLDALHAQDYCGVMSFDSQASEVANILSVKDSKDKIKEAIERVRGDKTQGGSTYFAGAIMKAGNALASITNVERKHIVIVTDGLPTDDLSSYGEYIANNVARDITMSVITIGLEGEVSKSRMADTAEAGGGRYENVESISELSSYMYDELTMQVIPPISTEKFTPTVKDKSSILVGIDHDKLPALGGYYGSVARDGARVPLMGKYVPIYATHKYGKGNVGSFMCDLEGIASAEFLGAPVGRKLVMNIVESIFPAGEIRADSISYELGSDNFSHWLNISGVGEGESVLVSVEPLSKHLLNSVDYIPVNVAESNVRYTFKITNPGLYRIIITLKGEDGQASTEIPLYYAFSYSEEYDTFGKSAEDGRATLLLLAEGGSGKLLSDPAEAYTDFTETLKAEFDPRIILIIAAIVLILLDIAVRKFKFKWIHELVAEKNKKD